MVDESFVLPTIFSTLPIMLSLSLSLSIYLSEVARVSRFAASLYGNVAACHLLSGRFDDARAVCDESLARDATDVRVVYRKARALMGLADYEQCRRVCHLGLALEPGNAALRRLHEAARVHGLSQQQPLVRGLRRFFGAS